MESNSSGKNPSENVSINVLSPNKLTAAADEFQLLNKILSEIDDKDDANSSKCDDDGTNTNLTTTNCSNTTLTDDIKNLNTPTTVPSDSSSCSKITQSNPVQVKVTGALSIKSVDQLQIKIADVNTIVNDESRSEVESIAETKLSNSSETSKLRNFRVSNSKQSSSTGDVPSSDQQVEGSSSSGYTKETPESMDYEKINTNSLDCRVTFFKPIGDKEIPLQTTEHNGSNSNETSGEPSLILNSTPVNNCQETIAQPIVLEDDKTLPNDCSDNTGCVNIVPDEAEQISSQESILRSSVNQLDINEIHGNDDNSFIDDYISNNSDALFLNPVVDLSLVKIEPEDFFSDDFNIEPRCVISEPYRIDTIKSEPLDEMDSTPSICEVRFRVDKRIKMYSREQLHAAKLISQSTLAAVVDMDMFSNVAKSMPQVNLDPLENLPDKLDLLSVQDQFVAQMFFKKYGTQKREWKKYFKHHGHKTHSSKKSKYLDVDKNSKRKLEADHHGAKSSKKAKKVIETFSPDGELIFLAHKVEYVDRDQKSDSNNKQKTKDIHKSKKSHKHSRKYDSKPKSKKILSESDSDSENNSMSSTSVKFHSSKKSKPSGENWSSKHRIEYSESFKMKNRLLFNKCRNVKVSITALSKEQLKPYSKQLESILYAKSKSRNTYKYGPKSKVRCEKDIILLNNQTENEDSSKSVVQNDDFQFEPDHPDDASSHINIKNAIDNVINMMDTSEVKSAQKENTLIDYSEDTSIISSSKMDIINDKVDSVSSDTLSENEKLKFCSKSSEAVDTPVIPIEKNRNIAAVSSKISEDEDSARNLTNKLSDAKDIPNSTSLEEDVTHTKLSESTNKDTSDNTIEKSSSSETKMSQKFSGIDSLEYNKSVNASITDDKHSAENTMASQSKNLECDGTSKVHVKRKIPKLKFVFESTRSVLKLTPKQRFYHRKFNLKLCYVKLKDLSRRRKYHKLIEKLKRKTDSAKVEAMKQVGEPSIKRFKSEKLQVLKHEKDRNRRDRIEEIHKLEDKSEERSNSPLITNPSKLSGFKIPKKKTPVVQRSFGAPMNLPSVVSRKENPPKSYKEWKSRKEELSRKELKHERSPKSSKPVIEGWSSRRFPQAKNFQKPSPHSSDFQPYRSVNGDGGISHGSDGNSNSPANNAGVHPGSGRNFNSPATDAGVHPGSGRNFNSPASDAGVHHGSGRILHSANDAGVHHSNRNFNSPANDGGMYHGSDKKFSSSNFNSNSNSLQENSRNNMIVPHQESSYSFNQSTADHPQMEVPEFRVTKNPKESISDDFVEELSFDWKSAIDSYFSTDQQEIPGLGNSKSPSENEHESCQSEINSSEFTVAEVHHSPQNQYTNAQNLIVIAPTEDTSNTNNELHSFDHQDCLNETVSVVSSTDSNGPSLDKSSHITNDNSSLASSIREKIITYLEQLDRKAQYKYTDKIKVKYYSHKRNYTREPGSRLSSSKKKRLYDSLCLVRIEYYTARDYMYKQKKKQELLHTDSRTDKKLKESLPTKPTPSDDKKGNQKAIEELQPVQNDQHLLEIFDEVDTVVSPYSPTDDAPYSPSETFVEAETTQSKPNLGESEICSRQKTKDIVGDSKTTNESVTEKNQLSQLVNIIMSNVRAEEELQTSAEEIPDLADAILASVVNKSQSVDEKATSSLMRNPSPARSPSPIRNPSPKTDSSSQQISKAETQNDGESPNKPISLDVCSKENEISIDTSFLGISVYGSFLSNPDIIPSILNSNGDISLTKETNGKLVKSLKKSSEKSIPVALPGEPPLPPGPPPPVTPLLLNSENLPVLPETFAPPPPDSSPQQPPLPDCSPPLPPPPPETSFPPPPPDYDPLPPPPCPLFAFPGLANSPFPQAVQEPRNTENDEIIQSEHDKLQSKDEVPIHNEDEDDTNFLASFGVMLEPKLNVAPLFDEEEILKCIKEHTALKVIPTNIDNEFNIFASGDVSKYYRDVPLAQLLLDKNDIPFVGLQYVVEVYPSFHQKTLEKCFYVCALCSKKMSSTTLVAHIKSVPHRLKFAEQHCPRLNQKYGSIQIKEWTVALVKDFTKEMAGVAADVGKFQMAVCSETDMNPVLAIIKENVGNLKKFRSYMVESPVCKEFYRKKTDQKPPAATSKSTSGLPDFLKQKLKMGLKRDSPQADSTTTPHVRSRDESPAMGGSSPKRMKDDFGSSESDTKLRVAAFRKDFDNFCACHAEKETYYQKNPESHPDYNAEWKLFWERRYQELISSGANPNKHDFKSEWILFWNDRMKDIFKTAVEAKRKTLLSKHRIKPEDLENKRPASPWEDDTPGQYNRDDFSVMNTLRALKKLESRLGTFGPAISALLVKAESSGPKALEIFLDTDNHTLVKLSVDKLSCLEKDVSDPIVQKQIYEATECCRRLFIEVENFRSSNDFMGLDIKEISACTLGMDSVQIAQQIALALLKLGKPNVSEDDLQRILLAVSASHAKIMMNENISHPSNNDDRHVSSTTPNIDSNNTKPLFPAAQTSKPVSQNEDGNSGMSGALGQLMSAYEEDDNPKDMDKLSLEDLVNLLSNFKDLSKDEQKALTSYLKKLEATDSRKVTKLREMVQQNMKAAAINKMKAAAATKQEKVQQTVDKDKVETENDKPNIEQPSVPDRNPRLVDPSMRDEPRMVTPTFNSRPRTPGFEERERAAFPERFPPVGGGERDFPHPDRPGAREMYPYDRPDLGGRPRDFPPNDRFAPRERGEPIDDPYYDRSRYDRGRPLDYDRERMYPDDRRYGPREGYPDEDRFRPMSPRHQRPVYDEYDRPIPPREFERPPYRDIPPRGEPDIRPPHGPPRDMLRPRGERPPYLGEDRPPYRGDERREFPGRGMPPRMDEGPDYRDRMRPQFEPRGEYPEPRFGGPPHGRQPPRGRGNRPPRGGFFNR